mgnify:CR=1 FL=1|jgi:uncharacterized membrane protein YhaH (DUF805 family)|tara:strand:- start:36 stop:383 length:348 start_codon:yes stop_codon:yes gene_type:complete
MGFVEAIKTVLFKKYGTFNGRASRSEYWFFFLAYILFAITLTIITEDDQWIPSMVLDVLLIIPSLAVGARRLHDNGRSGWNQLLVLTIIGIIPLLIWFCSKGEEEDNRFGADPLL